jgi:hypothetical protein
MTIQSTWVINRLECKPQEGTLADVVVVAHWSLIASDGTYEANAYGSTAMGPVGSEFTPFDQLTEAQVIDWVKGQIGAEGVTLLESSASQQIADQINPPIVTPSLPWALVAP